MSNIHNIPRRQAIKNGLLSACSLGVWISQSSLQADTSADTSADVSAELRSGNNMDLANLINTLRAMENDVCSTAAATLEASLDSGSPLYLHLRNAGLTPSDATILGDALKKLPNNDTNPLLSFSVSYNTQLGDLGAIALAQSIPNTLQEIGLVNCNIRDEGALALLHWAKQNPNLKMICIEGNEFTNETKLLFQSFSHNDPQVTVVY